MTRERLEYETTAGRPSAEAVAKVALLNHLRLAGTVRRDTVIVQELGVGKLANRADLALIDKDLHCFEIKTNRDTLARLDQQVEAYSSVANRVSVACATRHMKTALARLPEHVGLLEIVDIEDTPTLRPVRDARPSPLFSPLSALDFLPVAEIMERLMNNKRRLSRGKLIEACASLQTSQICEAVLSFLRDRYSSTSKEFISSTRRRKIQVSDLDLLRLWRKSGIFEIKSTCSGDGRDALTFRQIRTFGEVPEAVRRHLVA